MKEDYLWDKSGGDREIEALESTLSVYRYKPDTPPALPVPASENSRVRLWPWRIAFVPALAAIVIGAIAIGLWSRGTSPENVAQIAGPTDVRQPTVERPATGGSYQTETLPESRSELTREDNTLSQTSGRVSMLKPKRPARQVRREPQPTLTAEEKYAYDRLMLALSITGSKLRMVQDKANGNEIENLETKNNK